MHPHTPPPQSRRLSLPLQLPVHRLLDLLVRLRSVDEHAVDEEGRRPAHARRASRLQVLFDQRLLLAAVQALVELRGVDPHRLRVSLQVVHRELALVAEHLVVQLPELALVLSAGARFSRFPRERVEIERVVPEHQPHLPVVLLEDAVDHRDLAPAVGALEVAELDDGHRRVGRAARGALRLHLDARQVRRLERYLDMVLRLEIFEHLAHALAELLLPDALLDPGLQLVERLTRRNLRFVLFVERLRLGVGGFGNRAHVVRLDPLLERLALGLGFLLQELAADQLIEEAAPLVVQIGERLHLRLAQLGPDLLVVLQIPVTNCLSIDFRDLGGRVQPDAPLRGGRLPACLAGDERRGTQGQGVQRTALHDTLQTRRTADPKRARRPRQQAGSPWRSRTPAPARSRPCSSASRPWRWWDSRPTRTDPPTAWPCTCSRTATGSSRCGPAVARSSARRSTGACRTFPLPSTWSTTSAGARWSGRTSTRPSASASQPSGCRRASSTRRPQSGPGPPGWSW